MPSRPLFKIFILSFLCFASACSTVDFEAPKFASYANVDTSETTLARRIEPLQGERAPASGFYPLTDGMEALSARLGLIVRAEKTLDIQYYLWGDDAIGDLFFDQLLVAADRGVRVRLLIDDVGTRTVEDRLPVINAHPNIELRLFNPFAHRKLRAFDLWSGLRLNRRMHNKSLIADNVLTIMGGRNIADEYFSANPKYNFGDIDVIGIGAVAKDTSKMFDRYWNDRYSIPYEALNPETPNQADITRSRQSLKLSYATLAESPYAEVVGEKADVFDFYAADSYFWGRYKVIYDSPDKVRVNEANDDELLIWSLAKIAESAVQELLVVSPYFVPRRDGMDWLIGIAQRGVQVDVVTNGLAANDHLLVYGGYAPSRKPLLKAGVRFFELRGDLRVSGSHEAGAKEAASKLHGKAFVVDRRYTFIGSFNWDPRSVNLNTEMGVVIDSPELANAMAGGMYEAIPEITYTVTLNDAGDLRWQTETDGAVQIFEKEPESTWWMRLRANLTRILPIRSQL